MTGNILVRSMGAAAMVAAMAFAQPSIAASFDCGKASAPDEIAICDNPDLSALDSEMAGLYFGYEALPLLMGASGNRHDAAVAFLQERTKCGANVSCLRNVYIQRIATLKTNITEGVKDYCMAQ